MFGNSYFYNLVSMSSRIQVVSLLMFAYFLNEGFSVKIKN